MEVVAAAVSWWQQRQWRQRRRRRRRWRSLETHELPSSSRLFWAYSAQRTYLHSCRGECSRAYLLEEYGRLRWGKRGIHSRKRKASSTGKNGYVFVSRKRWQRKRHERMKKKSVDARNVRHLDARRLKVPIKGCKGSLERDRTMMNAMVD